MHETQRRWLGYVCLLVVIAAFTSQSELSQSLQRDHHYNHPYVIVWLNHVFLVFLFPPVLIYLYTVKPTESDGSASPTLSINSSLFLDSDASKETESLLSYPPGDLTTERKSRSAAAALSSSSASSRWSLGKYLKSNGYTWGKYWWTGLWVCFLYLAPNYAWYIALPMKGVAVAEANAVFNSSCIYVYVLSIFMLGEKWSFPKGFTVLIALGGVACIALKDSSGTHFSLSWGILIIFAASVAIGFYEVAYTKWVVRHGKLPLPLVLLLLAQNGLSHLLFFWFMIPVLNATNLEKFEWPNPTQAYYLVGNASLAFFGNLGLMSALAIFPSPLIVSVALLLIIPISGIVDTLMHKAEFTPLSYSGAALIGVSFLFLAFLEHREHKAKAALASGGVFIRTPSLA